MAGTNQGHRQASARAIHGLSGERTYNGDLRAMFEAEAVVPDGTSWNGACLIWINFRLGTTETSLPNAQQAFAESLGVSNWSAVGTFGAAP